METSIKIKSGSEIYEAIFLDSAIKELEKIANKQRLFILVDRNVSELYIEFIEKIKKISIIVICVEPQEDSKHSIQAQQCKIGISHVFFMMIFSFFSSYYCWARPN